MLILNTNRPPPLYPGCYVGALVIRFSYVPGNVVTLVKCHGSHSKDRKDKYNDKYMGKDKDRDKHRHRQE